MRVSIVGPGAIGGWIAARLANSGIDVSVVARGETLRKIQAEGLRLSEAGESRVVAVEAAADPAELGRQDVVIIALKAPALPHVAARLRPLIGPDSLIVPMLNGVPWWFTQEPLRSVDPEGRIAESLPIAQLIGSVVHASCRRSEPNHVHVVHSDGLIVGEPEGGRSERSDQICLLFENAGIGCVSSDFVRRAIWYKLWGNATINPLSALTRSRADKLLDNSTIRSWMARAMDELAAIGNAIDCPIGESSEDRMKVTERLGGFKSSMLQDVEAGRPIELEALVGAPREIARQVGIPTPQLDRIYALTRLMADNLGLV